MSCNVGTWEKALCQVKEEVRFRRISQDNLRVKGSVYMYETAVAYLVLRVGVLVHRW